MNEKNYPDSLQTVHPHYIGAYEHREDEINLVDFLIAFLAFKRVFLLSLVALIMLGLIAVTMFLLPKHTMSTVLNIARYNNGFVESPAALINRINVVILPDTTKNLLVKNDIGEIKTKVSNPIGTNLVVIENMVTKKDRALFSEFQNQIGLLVIESHKNLLDNLNADLIRRISLEQSVGDLKALSFDDYANKYETGVKKSILFIEDRIEKLTGNKKKLIQSISKQSQTTDSTLLMDNFNNNQEITGFVNQLLSLQQQITTNFRIYNNDFIEKKKRIVAIKNLVQIDHTRMSGSSKISIKSKGLTQAQAYLLLIPLSLFLAFFITLIAMFRLKVLKRIAEEA